MILLIYHTLFDNYHKLTKSDINDNEMEKCNTNIN